MASDDRSLYGIVIGSLGALGSACALVAVRGHVSQANVALVLVLFVLLGAVVGGRLAGAVSALVAAASFDFFFTHPYGSLKIANGEDILTTVLLAFAGIVAGELALRGERIRSLVRTGRTELTRIHRVAGLAGGGDTTDLVLAVTAELTDGLHLRSCRYEPAPFPAGLPVLQPTGSVATKEHWHTKHGFELPRDGVALPVTAGGKTLGRFVMVPTPGVGIPLESRLVAVALADQLGVALANAA